MKTKIQKPAPQPIVKNNEYNRSHWLCNSLSELIPVEIRYKATEILEKHLKHFGITSNCKN